MKSKPEMGRRMHRTRSDVLHAEYVEAALALGIAIDWHDVAAARRADSKLRLIDAEMRRRDPDDRSSMYEFLITSFHEVGKFYASRQALDLFPERVTEALNDVANAIQVATVSPCTAWLHIEAERTRSAIEAGVRDSSRLPVPDVARPFDETMQALLAAHPDPFLEGPIGPGGEFSHLFYFVGALLFDVMLFGAEFEPEIARDRSTSISGSSRYAESRDAIRSEAATVLAMSPFPYERIGSVLGHTFMDAYDGRRWLSRVLDVFEEDYVKTQARSRAAGGIRHGAPVDPKQIG